MQEVENFLKTGKISKVSHSGFQNISVLENTYGSTFLTYKIPSLEKVMKDGERGIIFGFRGFLEEGHVFNVIKKDGKLLYIDGQIANKANIRDGYLSFKYLKTN